MYISTKNMDNFVKFLIAAMFFIIACIIVCNPKSGKITDFEKEYNNIIIDDRATDDAKYTAIFTYKERVDTVLNKYIGGHVTTLHITYTYPSTTFKNVVNTLKKEGTEYIYTTAFSIDEKTEYDVYIDVVGQNIYVSKTEN